MRGMAGFDDDPTIEQIREAIETFRRLAQAVREICLAALRAVVEFAKGLVELILPTLRGLSLMLAFYRYANFSPGVYRGFFLVPPGAGAPGQEKKEERGFVTINPGRDQAYVE